MITGERAAPVERQALPSRSAGHRIPEAGRRPADNHEESPVSQPSAGVLAGPMAAMRVVEAADLVLEPQTAAHADEMFAVLGDPAIYEFENEPPPSLEWLRTRYAKLESRRSADGREQWLNWVIRLPTSKLIGYVQATVHPNGCAAIAYELASAHWGRGLARQAIEAMILELAERHGVRSLSAVLKRENFRSLRLLERLGFSRASPEAHLSHRAEPGELLMLRDIRRQ
jgi:RimJ/RimL family protein N-acetyltransferase